MYLFIYPLFYHIKVRARSDDTTMDLAGKFFSFFHLILFGQMWKGKKREKNLSYSVYINEKVYTFFYIILFNIRRINK